MAIKVVFDRKPENVEKKANDFLQGKYLINITACSVPDYEETKKTGEAKKAGSYIALFIAYK